MSCQPSPSRSATQTPGPNSSRLIEMPLLPLKWTNLMPAAAVTFMNSIAGCELCACRRATESGSLTIRASKKAREKTLLAEQRRWYADSAEFASRSEEHTSELQSRPHLVCRLLLEKKK